MSGADDKISLEFLRRQLEASKALPDAALKSGGGDGTFDGMLERVIKLEASTEHLQRDVSDLRGDMKDIRDRLKSVEVKIDHLPSKGFIVSAVVIGFILVAGVSAFSGNITRLINPTTAPPPAASVQAP